MAQNSNTRYLHTSINAFAQKLWSWRFEIYLALEVLVEAPAFGADVAMNDMGTRFVTSAYAGYGRVEVFENENILRI